MSATRLRVSSTGPDRLQGVAGLGQAQLADTPAALYLMQETSGTVMMDSSGNGRDGTWTSATLAQSPISNNGLPYSVSFDGSNTTGVTVYDTWQNSNSWTAEVLIYPTAFTSYRTIFCRAASGTYTPWWMLLDPTGGYYFEGNNTTPAGLQLTNGTGDLSLNTPYLITTKWDATTHFITIYKNGTSWISGAIASPYNAQTSTNPLRVGKNGSGTYAFSGRMSHFAFYTSALSDARITAHASLAGLA